MPARVFFSYSHHDEALRNQLEVHLAALKRQGIIEPWHDRRIDAGEEFADVIDRHVESDDIILLLVSPDFIASDYCYEREMKRAMERHERGEAIVIPVILRPCDWQRTPFGKLNATPPDGKPVTLFANTDQAFLEVTTAIRRAADRMTGKHERPEAAPTARAGDATHSDRRAGPRSSNLRLAKTFTDRDKDRFKRETFDYIARFFENSLQELSARNDSVQGDFQQIDANRFTAAIYQNGRAASRCTVFLGEGNFARGIAYSESDNSAANSYNELLTVEADEQSMFLRPMGLAVMASGRERAR